MAENLYIPEGAGKAEIYEALIPQLRNLIAGEEDLVANTANTAAALKQAFDFFWVGFYFDDRKGELVLGPFQGPIACTRIRYDRGVCGHAFTTRSTTLVPDVDQFPGHIACSSASRSEIVLPLKDTRGHVIGVLDIDSERLNDFDETDKKYLEEITAILAGAIKN
ncbi:GAF domain-containing protein [Leadbetterella sp. DM7]|uniref:GAF domain-containing protein n=1 Tax=Leadbetterella sp. DM7 TaxID=3235085 RepID=UPI00349E607F